MDTNPTPAPRKLYRIREGAMLAGVCNGLAAYLDIDVTVVRVVFVILGAITSGGFIAAYVILAILMPVQGEGESAWQSKWRHKFGRYTTPTAYAVPSTPAYDYHYVSRRPTLIEELLQVVLVAVVIYALYTYIPQTRPFFDLVWRDIQQAWYWVVAHLNQPVK